MMANGVIDTCQRRGVLDFSLAFHLTALIVVAHRMFGLDAVVGESLAAGPIEDLRVRSVATPEGISALFERKARKTTAD